MEAKLGATELCKIKASDAKINPKTDPESAQNRPQIGPKSSPKRSKIEPKSASWGGPGGRCDSEPILAPFLVVLEAPGAAPGRSRGPLGAVLGRLGGVPGPPGAGLGASWGLPGASWGVLGASPEPFLGHFGGSFADLVLGALSEAIFDQFPTILGAKLGAKIHQKRRRVGQNQGFQGFASDSIFGPF